MQHPNRLIEKTDDEAQQVPPDALNDPPTGAVIPGQIKAGSDAPEGFLLATLLKRR
ncbi:hypothetical protein MESS4_750162 [Mesorhizobium sp. STM 4661]|nr:hypothetical protein MESS4_750162 [Mesorhizobium sp. STM 4661]